MTKPSARDFTRSTTRSLTDALSMSIFASVHCDVNKQNVVFPLSKPCIFNLGPSLAWADLQKV